MALPHLKLADSYREDRANPPGKLPLQLGHSDSFLPVPVALTSARAPWLLNTCEASALLWRVGLKFTARPRKHLSIHDAFKKKGKHEAERTPLIHCSDATWGKICQLTYDFRANYKMIQNSHSNHSGPYPKSEHPLSKKCKNMYIGASVSLPGFASLVRQKKIDKIHQDSLNRFRQALPLAKLAKSPQSQEC